ASPATRPVARRGRRRRARLAGAAGPAGAGPGGPHGRGRAWPGAPRPPPRAADGPQLVGSPVGRGFRRDPDRGGGGSAAGAVLARNRRTESATRHSPAHTASTSPP